MSHFTGIIVGEVKSIPRQLKKYNENHRVPKYKIGDVTDAKKQRFINYCVEKGKLDDVNTSFESAYKKLGKDWNNNDWVKNSEGIWEDFSTYNPNSKWDWYSVGGRWTGFFKLKPGKKGKIGNPGLMTDPAKYGYVDQCRKGDIDIEGMSQDSYDKAFEYYNLIASCFTNSKIPELDFSWEEVTEKNQGMDIDDLRKIYREQPAMLALEAARKSPNLKKEQRDALIWVVLDHFKGFTAEDYAKQAASEALNTYCIIVNGEWFQKGDMGWFGVSANESDNWAETFQKIWDSIHPNCIVTLLDFHI